MSDVAAPVGGAASGPEAGREPWVRLEAGTLVVDGAENPDAAWYYPEPKSAAAEIKDRIAFWRGVKVG